MKATLIIGCIGLIISSIYVISIKDFALKVLSSIFCLLFTYLITLSNCSLLVCISNSLHGKLILFVLLLFATSFILHVFKKSEIVFVDKALITGLCLFMFLGQLIVYSLYPVHSDIESNIFLLGRLLELLSCGCVLFLLVRAFFYKMILNEAKVCLLYIVYFLFEFAYWKQINPDIVLSCV